MYYIFNKSNQCIASCNNLPNKKDLETREEFYVEDEKDITYIELLRYNNGKIEVHYPEEKKPTYEEILNETKEKLTKNREVSENEDILYNNKLYQADLTSLNRLSLALKLDDKNIEWKTSDNSVEVLTKEDINNILKLIAERNSEIFAFVSDTKDKINAINKNKIAQTITEDEAKEMLLEIQKTFYL